MKNQLTDSNKEAILRHFYQGGMEILAKKLLSTNKILKK
jgi:hypothetical protein